MPTGGVRFPFAGLTTADVPTVIRITQEADFTARFRTDIPVNVIEDPSTFAAQFTFATTGGPQQGDLSGTISSTSFFVSWLGITASALSVIYFPGAEPVTSRLGAPMEFFVVAIPFP